MHFAPSEDQEAFLTGLQRLLADSGDRAIARRAATRDDGIDPDFWQLLGDVGVFGLSIAESVGGQGGGWLDVCLAMEVFGSALVECPIWPHLLATRLLSESPAHHADLDAYLAGTKRAAFVWDDGQLTPHAAGADGAVWARDGQLRWITKDDLAAATTEVAVIDPGWRCADVALDPAVWARATTLNTGDLTAQKAREMAVSAVANGQAGSARAAMELTVAYTKERRQFGRAIGTFQAVQHHCADMFVAVETARSAAWYAAYCCDSLPDELTEAAAIAGTWCSEVAFSVASTAIQVHGGIGFTAEHDCHLFFKRAEMTRHLFGGAAGHESTLSAAVGL